jgi:hypothetical protein
LDGKIVGNKLSFKTQTLQSLNDEPAKETEHRYKGSVSENEIRFVMQTVGGYSNHVPIEFTAKRVANP